MTATTTDVRDILRAVIEDPDDDAARGVPADAVEEGGDPGRAALIRNEVALETGRWPGGRLITEDEFMALSPSAWGPFQDRGAAWAAEALGCVGLPPVAAVRMAWREATFGVPGSPPSFTLHFRRGLPFAFTGPVSEYLRLCGPLHDNAPVEAASLECGPGDAPALAALASLQTLPRLR